MPVTINSSSNVSINGVITINNPLVVILTPYVQFATFNSTVATASFSVTFTAGTPTSGNLLILIANAGQTFTTPVGWTKNNTNVQDTETSIYSKISNGTETTLTINLTSGTATGNMVGIEWPTWTTLDKTSVDTGVVASPNQAFTTTAIPTAASEIAIAVSGGDLASPQSSVAPTISWTNGFTQLSLGGAVVGNGPPYDIMMGVAYKVLTVAAAVSTQWNWTTPTSTVGLWNNLIVTYK